MKPACDPASLERAAREAEMRARDKFCPECGAQVWPVDGINVGVDRYHQVRHTAAWSVSPIMFQACVVCNECGLGPEEGIAMVLGPKDRLGQRISANPLWII